MTAWDDLSHLGKCDEDMPPQNFEDWEKSTNYQIHIFLNNSQNNEYENHINEASDFEDIPDEFYKELDKWEFEIGKLAIEESLYDPSDEKDEDGSVNPFDEEVYNGR